MLRRFARWRADQVRLAAVDRYMEAQCALLADSDPVRHDQLVIEAEGLERRATWWSQIARRFGCRR